MTTESLNSAIKHYIQNPAFRAPQSLHQSNPWHRPLVFDEQTINGLKAIDSYDEITTANGYLLNKLLFSIYEQRTIFLANNKLNEQQRTDFEQFYRRDSQAQGMQMMFALENKVFDFLFNDIEKRDWQQEDLVQVLVDSVKHEDQCELGLDKVLNDIEHKHLSTQMYLLHKASDFLTEGSAMPKSLCGSAGEIHMSLMKIFMDEYGSGDMTRKHSQLFKRAMCSAGLSDQPHTYHEDYLPASLMMTNYFHYVCDTPEHFFRYLGALYFAEATTVEFFTKLRDNFKFNDPEGLLDLEYFEEHIVVDQKHRDIALQELVVASLERYGNDVAQQIYEGFETFRRLAISASIALNQQIYFADSVLSAVKTDRSEALNNAQTLTLEGQNKAFAAQIAQQEMTLLVSAGQLEVSAGNGAATVLSTGNYLTIPAGRLYRMRAANQQNCTIQITR